MKKNILALGFFLVLLFSSFHSVDATGAGIIGPEVIHKESNQIFTIIDLLSLYEDDVFVETDGYTGQGNLPGEYIVTLTQGLLTKDVTIVVIENWDNLERSNEVLFVADYKDIYVSSNRRLTLYEIIYYIYSSTGLVVTEYQFRYEELINQYHSSFDEDDNIPEGNYELSFRLTYYSGQQSTYSTSINVVELQEIPGIILEPPPSTIDRIMSFVPWVLVIGVIVYFFTNRKKKRGFY